MTTMIAATYEQGGDAAAVLQVREVERPEPGPGQVRVRVAVSAINPTDVKIRSGLTPRPIDGFQVPHMDGAGTIDAVGEGVDASRIGERVWLQLAADGNRYGTAAQWCVVADDHAVRLADDASFALGATLGVPAVTAAHCLFSDGPITGKHVLVAGGAGAVGRAAVQLARWAGAHVAATVSSDDKAAIAREAGAEHIVRYRDTDAIEQLRAWSTHVDRIIELDLGANLDLDLAVSGYGTTIVTYAAAPGADPSLPVRRLMYAQATLQFMLLYGVPAADRATSAELVQRALAEHALTMPVAQHFPLDRIADAHLAQEAGPFGRVLVDIP